MGLFGFKQVQESKSYLESKSIADKYELTLENGQFILEAGKVNKKTIEKNINKFLNDSGNMLKDITGEGANRAKVSGALLLIGAGSTLLLSAVSIGILITALVNAIASLVAAVITLIAGTGKDKEIEQLQKIKFNLIRAEKGLKDKKSKDKLTEVIDSINNEINNKK